ncbi:MAG: hypothetical protein KF908_15350 [Nitrosomonas sp.]|nr:hypothetical protein [Nitrosomonas sp.]MCW5608894.1 hypothetical protein [Nitrosomonas sp.]
MKKTSKRGKTIPFFLIPKIRKRHVPPIFKDRETQWKLFAEGALRNNVFHNDVIRRGKTCLACNRHFNHEQAAVSSKIDKHHHCYLRLCIGSILLEGSSDIYRPPHKGEYSPVPDCRQCKASNPAYYAGCIKKIFPVHHHCHEQIHEREKFWFNTLSKKLLFGFRSATSLQT